MTKNFFRLSALLFLMLLPTLNAQPVWEKVGVAIGNYTYIRCIDDLNCIGMATHSGGDGKLIKTTDGGKTWFDLYVEKDSIDENGNLISGPDPREMNSISYVDKNHIYVGRNKGCIFVSRDAGKSFDTVVIAEKIDNKFVSGSRIFALHMADSLNGASISPPYICITDDGWKTFKRIKLDNIFVPEGFSYSIGGALFNNLKFWNKDCYMMSIVISKFNVNHFEYLLRGVIITKDGGKTWIYPDCIELFKSEFDTNHFSFFSIKFINSKIGWLVGYLQFDHNSNYEYGTVLKTYDGGITWNLIYIDKTLPNYGLFDVDFKDELNGTAVGKFGHIIRTTDGGYTWFRDSFLNLSSDERNWRIVQKVTYAGEHVLLSTFGDGIWRGTYSPSSVKESAEAGNGLSVSPNPATEYIEINIENKGLQPLVNNEEIKIFNTLGECLMTVETIHELSLQRIDVSSLPRGVYYLRIGSRTQMFVKM